MISKCKKYFEIEEQFLSILEKERILFTNYIILDRGEIIEKWLLKRGIFWIKMLIKSLWWWWFKKTFSKHKNWIFFIFSKVNNIKRDNSYFIYEEFLQTDGFDIKVYTIRPKYTHTEARK